MLNFESSWFKDEGDWREVRTLCTQIIHVQYTDINQ